MGCLSILEYFLGDSNSTVKGKNRKSIILNAPDCHRNVKSLRVSVGLCGVAWPECNCLYTHPAVDPLVNEPLVQPASPLNFLNLLIAGELDWRRSQKFIRPYYTSSALQTDYKDMNFFIYRI